MAQCTAPINGHRTASGRANCPVCGQRGYNSYPSIFPQRYSSLTSSSIGSSPASNKSSSGGSGKQTKAKAYWATNSSTI